jgi:hypothetical protein
VSQCLVESPPVECLDELRTWPNDRLLAARDEAVVAERRWQQRRISLDRVLDERGAMQGRDAAEWVQSRDKVSAQTARAEVEVARALEALPAIKAKADAGLLSMGQLEPLVQLATPETDAEWATRGAHTQPGDLNRLVRKQRVVTPAEMEARRQARELRWWRSRDGLFLNLRGQIPDVDGALVEAVLEHEIETMKPPPGEQWDTRAHRGSDAIAAICRRAHQPAETTSKRSSWKPTVVIHFGSDAQPTVNGMPIAVETVDELIADGARVREVHDDDPLAPSRGDAIPAKLRIYLKGRDATCRVPGCGRAFGLEAHHLVPRYRGGATDRHNVALVCTTHHHQLIPHGRWVLDGDPEAPDGLVLRELTDTVEARAGPDAA